VLQFEGRAEQSTFHVADGGGSHVTVLRKKARPASCCRRRTKSDREYRGVIKGSGRFTPTSPVPKPYALCRDDSVIGTTFYIMQFPAPAASWPIRGCPASRPTDRGRIFDSMNDVARPHPQCRLSRRRPGATTGGRGQYIQRQLARWSSQVRFSPATEHIGAMEALKQWLPAQPPAG